MQPVLDVRARRYYRYNKQDSTGILLLLKFAALERTNFVKRRYR